MMEAGAFKKLEETVASLEERVRNNQEQIAYLKGKIESVEKEEIEHLFEIIMSYLHSKYDATRDRAAITVQWKY